MKCFNITPLTEEELEKSELHESGIYDFEVLKSVSKTSKSGNPMSELTIRIWDKQGVPFNIFDYLVFSQITLNIRKVKHFCEAIGHDDWYAEGKIPEELGGYSGRLELGYQKEKEKEGGGFWPAKNVVLDYLKPTMSHTKPVDDFKSDDVPF